MSPRAPLPTPSTGLVEASLGFLQPWEAGKFQKLTPTELERNSDVLVPLLVHIQVICNLLLLIVQRKPCIHVLVYVCRRNSCTCYHWVRGFVHLQC